MEYAVWTNSFPNSEVLKIKDHLAFFTEKLEDVFIDGERLPESETKWK